MRNFYKVTLMKKDLTDVKTNHIIRIADARNLSFVEDCSINLVITSPPYPMIDMWDTIFTSLNPEIGEALSDENGKKAFQLMHEELDKIWQEVFRVLSPGGIACINVGDAVRKIGSDFRIYQNHAKILQSAEAIGFQPLPWILWRKPTNAPNKFMGSGMLPPGAYVTLEHEFVLILRKGGKRVFALPKDRERRRKSAYFWEERNKWFSDLWQDVTGITQKLPEKSARTRSGAFPLELPLRLINMFSLYEDTVLDPFLGTGTTIVAAMILGRNSVGIEIDESLLPIIEKRIDLATQLNQEFIRERIRAHQAFVKTRVENNEIIGYHNRTMDLPVVTSQETDLIFYVIKSVEKRDALTFEVTYEPFEKTIGGTFQDQLSFE